MCWEIHYIHPQSGHMLFVNMLQQAVAGCAAAAGVCSTENLGTNMHK